MTAVWLPMAFAIVGLALVALATGLLGAVGRRLAEGLRAAAWQRLDARRASLDHAALEQSSLVALFDEYEDLRSADRHTGARLDRLARMYLDLFQAAWDLSEGKQRKMGSIDAARAARWAAYMSNVYSDSGIVRAALQRDVQRYSPELVEALAANDPREERTAS